MTVTSSDSFGTWLATVGPLPPESCLLWWTGPGQMLHSLGARFDATVYGTSDLLHVLGLLTALRDEVGRVVSERKVDLRPLTATPLLTEDEHLALELTGQLAGVLARLVGDGDTRTADLAELVAKVHDLQHAVLAQAAARACPGQYRLLGETLPVGTTKEDTTR
jgi:hypothetical protein